ncbi:hypothetical protein [Sphingobium boeckii]|uniref:Cellobiose-specific phosphotransferase system component IIC n=1 Tax=Sphingobium boeckii TaxID=1082345 RepID=A0A7W9AIN6_9SPHN|nr:hypothetical protein [Sphingobium boeckii]MBB5686161.1 cellobiose-specific phosphotransferase system component IIC [Sphingobium boeckii]
MNAGGRAIVAALPALLWLTGCDGAQEVDPVEHVTVDEAQALNDAAAMLDGNGAMESQKSAK